MNISDLMVVMQSGEVSRMAECLRLEGLTHQAAWQPVLDKTAANFEFSPFGLPCLLAAVAQEQDQDFALSVVNLLLDSGYPVDGINLTRGTPLQVALGQQNFAVAQRLLDTGAVVDAQHPRIAQSHFPRPWFQAAAAGHTGFLSRLHAMGINLNEADKNGTTALMIASDHGHLEAVKWLLNHGADYDQEDVAGHNAAHRCDNPDMAKLLPLIHHSVQEKKILAAASDEDLPALNPGQRGARL